MKILIAGASGQLAKALIDILKSKDNIFLPDEKNFDITDFNIVSRIISDIKPDIVINCAAYNDVDKAENEWQKAFLVNGIGVKNLALACNKNNAVFVHFSSDYVFDGLKNKPYTIIDKTNPINKYGESKLLGEELLKNHINKFFLIRTSWVFGDGNFSFPKKVIEWSGKNNKLKIVDDQISCPTFTNDLADAVSKIIQTENYGIYHITNTNSCSRFEWAEFILKTIKWDGEISPAKSKEFNTPAIRPGYTVLDNFPLKETMGYLLPSWQDATKKFIKDKTFIPNSNWYKGE